MAKKIVIPEEKFDIEALQKAMTGALMPLGDWTLTKVDDNTISVSKGMLAGTYKFNATGEHYVTNKPYPNVWFKKSFIWLIIVLAVIAWPIPFIMAIWANSVRKKVDASLNPVLVNKFDAAIS